jgi:polysaccharide pyruvyl transferase WcaK-like protein
LGVKKQLGECAVTVAARMHCAINSIVESTPTIFLSYSQKSIGMCQYVYGETDYLVKMEDIEKNLENVFDRVWMKKADIVNQLTIRNKEIDDEYDKGLEELRKILE